MQSVLFSDYKNGIFLSIFSGLCLLLILYIYSRNTLPENEVFFSSSLYSFASVVFLTFLMLFSLIILGIKMTFFSKKYFVFDPNTLVYHIQSSLRYQKYRTLFILVTITYFVLFGFLSNMFIIFNSNGTPYSLFSISDQIDRNSSGTQNNINVNKNHNRATLLDNTYPKYSLIICCNSYGQVPMLILSFSPQFSFLLIPINFLLGGIISILVGLNMAMNIYLLRHRRSTTLSKRGFFSMLGISSGLFVGCPVCAGSFFYSLAGFSSLITFSYLSIYQVVFIIISIPVLLISIVVMAKLIQINYFNICKIK